MYHLKASGYPAEQVKVLNLDLLVVSHYLYIYWVNHLYNWNSNHYTDCRVNLQDRDAVNVFIRKNTFTDLKLSAFVKVCQTV